MADKTETCYQDCCVQSFQFYLEHSGEHQAMVQSVRAVLPAEFKRMGEGESSLGVLGVGSGGGQMDVEILTLLQATRPGVPVTADVVEGSVELTDNFKALVGETANLKTVPFSWHIMSSEDYVKQAAKQRDVKRFDFIHMIQMIYYVDNMADTIKLYQSLLKPNGRLMIIVETANGGWDTLWKTHKKDLCTHTITEYRSSAEVKAALEKLNLKYDEHMIPNEFDLSECFDPKSELGHKLLNFMTAKDDFYKDFEAKTREAILDLLRNKCSTEKDGKVMFDSALSCLLVHA